MSLFAHRLTPQQGARRALRAAHALAPDFEVDLDKLAELSERLDGLPFALDEVGARLPMLGLEAVLAQLADGQLDALTKRRLAAHLAAPLALLPDADRVTLEALTVLRGAFSAEAVSAVLDRPLASVFEALESLLKHRWLHHAGHGRLRLLRPIRAALSTPPTATALDRHARWFAAQAEVWTPLARGVRAAEARAWAASAEADLLLALHTVSHSRTDGPGGVVALLESVTAFDVAWDPEPVELMRVDALLPADREARARADLALGRLALSRGRAEDADRRFAAAFDAADAGIRGRALVGRAGVRAQRHDVATALALYDEAEALFEATGDLAGFGQARAWRGLALMDHDDVPTGIACLGEAARALERAGDLVGLAVHESNLAIGLQRQGALSEARHVLERALARARAAGHRRFALTMASNLGGLMQCLGDFESAAAQYAEVERDLLWVLDPRVRFALALGKGTNAQAMQAFEVARVAFEAARRLAWQLDDADLVRLSEGHLGGLFAQTGDLVEADACFARARPSGAEGGLPITLTLLAGQRKLAEWQAAFEHGRDADALAAIKTARGLAMAQRTDGIDSVRVRRARILLLRACDLAADRMGADGPVGVPAAGELVIEPGARGIWLPDGRYLDLRRRRLGRRLLLALVEAHQAEPGTLLDLHAMWRAGWGQERILPAAQRNRIYVAVASLRRLGFKGLLQSRPGGYRLDPGVLIQCSEGLGS